MVERGNAMEYAGWENYQPWAVYAHLTGEGEREDKSHCLDGAGRR